MDNSKQIDFAAEYVKTMVSNDANIQNKEVVYAQIDRIKNELKSLDSFMNGRMDLAMIYKALSEKQ